MEDVLDLVPRLKSLSISLYEDIDGAQVARYGGPPIVHKSLQSLSFSGGEVLPPGITCPALEQVSICRYGPYGEPGPGLKCPLESLPALANLLHRSNCSLKTLYLSDVEMNASLSELLRSTPSITNLHIDCRHYDMLDDEELAAVVEGLIYDPLVDKKKLLPNLEILELFLGRCPNPFKNPGAPTRVVSMGTAFCALVDSRTSGSPQPKRQGDDTGPADLRRVSFRASDAIYPILRYADIEALERHKAAGLDISIKTDRPTFHADHNSLELYDSTGFYVEFGRSVVTKFEGVFRSTDAVFDADEVTQKRPMCSW